MRTFVTIKGCVFGKLDAKSIQKSTPWPARANERVRTSLTGYTSSRWGVKVVKGRKVKAATKVGC